MGRFQGENLATVLQTVEVLRTDGWNIPEETVIGSPKCGSQHRYARADGAATVCSHHPMRCRAQPRRHSSDNATSAGPAIRAPTHHLGNGC